MLSDNGRRLEAAVSASLTMDAVPSEDDVLSLARQLRSIPVYGVDDAEFEQVIKRLHASLRISMSAGTVVDQEHVPWLSARRAQIDPFYWGRYARYLTQQGWSPRVVTVLDEVTDGILDRLGNPASDAGWPRRGLVMGDVQSGKTSNYTGLICKAADAGYRLIILLTGTLESLRRQTQGRLDAGFVGVDSSGILNRERRTREVGVGRIDGQRSAGVFTSTQRDFSTMVMNQLGFQLSAFREPVLLVVKKHKRILENLAAWLTGHNADHHGRIDAPMLLIDDEADNASVNTRGENSPTAINRAIRELLHVFTRSSYVGFTATPFANVFIDPESESEMIGSDLFPRDFIYALDAPSNYFGTRSVFGDDASFDCLRPVTDAAAIFPPGHKSDLPVHELPQSLRDAIGCFVLVNAIIDLRRTGSRHRSMLVNVSHYTRVQEQVRELVAIELRQLKSDLRHYSRLPETEALRCPSMAHLRDLWVREYADSGQTWAQVQRALAEAALPIEVRAVNQKSGAASLDYMPYQETGLRVIAVGGNSLSRGLTLEGLCISYFWRGTQMYDTLLQMGRWFGYRDGYADLCRIHMADEAIDWYAHIAEATEELRGEIRHMQQAGLKPIDFGLKVRAHPDSLLITARNKMRYSEEIERIVSVSGESLESYRLLTDPRVVASNAVAVRRFTDELDRAGIGCTRPAGGNPLWRNVPVALVSQLLRHFVGHPQNIRFQARELADFLDRCNAPKLALWDVVVPTGNASDADQAPVTATVGGQVVQLQKRRLLVDNRARSILVSERKMRVGSRGIEREGLSAERIRRAEEAFTADPANADRSISDAFYRRFRERPLLLVHLLHGVLAERDAAGKTLSETPWVVKDGPLCALGLSFPHFDDTAEEQRVRYRVNLVEWRHLIGDDVGDDEDEGDGDA